MGSKSTSVCVVGGGMLGMTLAHRLRQGGRDVTLLEAGPALGGLASAWQVGDVVWDRHYHVTLLSDRFNRAILDELGLDEEMRWVTTRTGCYANGRLHSMSNAIEFLKFPALGIIDKFRLAWTILYASRIDAWQKLENISVETWLRRVSGNTTYEKFWLPLLISKLGSCHREVSAAFIWATIQRLYAARRSGLKEEMFGYLPGGYARILQAFGERLADRGIEIHLNTRVESVKRDGDKYRLVTSNGSLSAQEVVVTAPAPVAAEICPELTTRERASLSDTRYMGVLCASVLLRKPLEGFYVTNLTDDGFPFTGIIEMTALVDRGEFDGRSLVYLPRYLSPDDDYASRPDAEIQSGFLDGLRRVYPSVSDDDVEAFRISRARHVMPIPTIGYSESVLPFSTSLPGLWLVNSSHIINGTLNVNETVCLAERAATEILENEKDL